MADAWRDGPGIARTPIRARRMSQMQAELRKRMGKGEFEAAYRAGGALPFPDALEEISALAEGA